MLSRKEFIQKSSITIIGTYLLPGIMQAADPDSIIMTVTGPVHPATMGFTLSHEHILVDFIGAEKIRKERYNAEEVFGTALPFLIEAKEKGCATFADCTPAYLGRDVNLLQRLSKETGLNIISNTGYYGAANEKYLPKFVYSETAEQIAARWIDEWKNGIEGTGIKPGFIKTGVDKGPLSPVLRKL
jgi:phosphotriesterase-related protein